MLKKEQREAIYRLALQQQYADLCDYLDSITVPSNSCGYSWNPKDCPCGPVQHGDCLTEGCKWERFPSLVPEMLRVYQNGDSNE